MHEERCPECGNHWHQTDGRWLTCWECGIGADQSDWIAAGLAWDEPASDPQDEAEAMIDAMEGYGYAD
jgi:hypothetical protein